jgi:hypothetical protein
VFVAVGEPDRETDQRERGVRGFVIELDDTRDFRTAAGEDEADVEPAE